MCCPEGHQSSMQHSHQLAPAVQPHTTHSTHSAQEASTRNRQQEAVRAYLAEPHLVTCCAQQVGCMQAVLTACCPTAANDCQRSAAWPMQHDNAPPEVQQSSLSMRSTFSSTPCHRSASSSCRTLRLPTNLPVLVRTSRRRRHRRSSCCAVGCPRCTAACCWRQHAVIVWGDAVGQQGCQPPLQLIPQQDVGMLHQVVQAQHKGPERRSWMQALCRDSSNTASICSNACARRSWLAVCELCAGLHVLVLLCSACGGGAAAAGLCCCRSLRCCCCCSS